MTAVDAVNAPVVRVRRLDRVGDAEVRALAEVLVDVVAGDGSVSFMHPLDPARAETFWRSVADGVARGERALLVAEEQVGDPDGPDGGWQVVGSVHLVLALPENQPHRADVTKLVVHRRARRRGEARTPSSSPPRPRISANRDSSSAVETTLDDGTTLVR